MWIFVPVTTVETTKVEHNITVHVKCFDCDFARSGTYNNQYMIIDLKKVTVGNDLADGTLWVVEQIPGLVVGEDQTTILRAGLFELFAVQFRHRRQTSWIRLTFVAFVVKAPKTIYRPSASLVFVCCEAVS